MGQRRDPGVLLGGFSGSEGREGCLHEADAVERPVVA